MKRSVRNGLAIAGMAGGIFFLGEAMAQADTADLSNDNGTVQEAGTSQQGPGDSGNADNANGTLQVNAADTSQKVVNAPQQTSYASNSVNVTLPAGAPAKVVVEDVNIDQNAVSKIDGGNQTVDLPAQGPVVLSNSNTTTQNADTASENKRSGHGGGEYHGSSNKVASFGNGGGDEGDASNGNLTGQINLYDGSTTIINRPVQDSTASNSVNIDFSNATFYCGDQEWLASSTENTKKCEYYIKIEGLDINQNAVSTINGGNQVIGSGAKPEEQGKEHGQKPVVCPEEKAPVKAVAAPAHKAKAHSVNMVAQPSKGQLAYTGAETSTPLTLGLIALGAGGALTLAGRRRQTATV